MRGRAVRAPVRQGLGGASKVSTSLAFRRRTGQDVAMNGTNAPETPAITPETPPLRVDEQGVIRVGPTRVTLDTLVAAFHRGETPEEIASNYDALSLAEVYQTIGYYLAHQSEVDAYLERRQLLRASVREQAEAHHNPNGIRERLLARRRQPA